MEQNKDGLAEEVKKTCGSIAGSGNAFAALRCGPPPQSQLQTGARPSSGPPAVPAPRHIYIDIYTSVKKEVYSRDNCFFSSPVVSSETRASDLDVTCLKIISTYEPHLSL